MASLWRHNEWNLLSTYGDSIYTFHISYSMTLTRQEHMLQFEVVTGSDYGDFIVNIWGRLPSNITNGLHF